MGAESRQEGGRGTQTPKVNDCFWKPCLFEFNWTISRIPIWWRHSFCPYIGNAQWVLSEAVAQRPSWSCNFIKKEAQTQVPSCEFCEISINTLSYRAHVVTASVLWRLSLLFFRWKFSSFLNFMKTWANLTKAALRVAWLKSLQTYFFLWVIKQTVYKFSKI